MENVLKFEVGDIAHCPYYGYTGVITEIKPNQNGDDLQDWIILVNPSLGDNNKSRCVAKLKTVSVNSPTPSYLQLIMKKADFEKINKLTVFGYPKIN